MISYAIYYNICSLYQSYLIELYLQYMFIIPVLSNRALFIQKQNKIDVLGVIRHLQLHEQTESIVP
jgi:hypothetical protein